MKLVRASNVGVPYGSRTRVAAVKVKRPIGISRDVAAWIALYRTCRTHGNAYWTFNGRSLGCAAALPVIFYEIKPRPYTDPA
jgi:hypothetical protein